MNERYVAADKKTGRPGCVIIQAILGGDRDLLHDHFDDRTWEVGEIKNMIPVPEDLLPRWTEKFGVGRA